MSVQGLTDQEPEDIHLTLLDRKSWTRQLGRRLLPLRYRDVLPEPLPHIRPVPPSPTITTTQSPIPLDDPVQFPRASTASTGLTHNFFATEPNKFGLSRHYSTVTPPSHDPEEHVTLEDLSNVIESVSPDPAFTETFSPYPNRNAFLLGDWYWNGGVQKSQANFQSLIDVVGDPAFSPADVRDVSWKDINCKLVLDDEWIDEDANRGWQRTPVSISVPFQRRCDTPSSCDPVPQQFTVSDFYHRNLISVIREKLACAADDDFFHYQPYKLKWQSAAHPEPVDVYGELYNAQAFIDADRELQSLPSEPNCTAPRHIVALMFASDSTRLTSFGDASLWPLYLYFGNESKYRRCKPSCHLGTHVAYFQKVCL